MWKIHQYLKVSWKPFKRWRKAQLEKYLVALEQAKTSKSPVCSSQSLLAQPFLIRERRKVSTYLRRKDTGAPQIPRWWVRVESFTKFNSLISNAKNTSEEQTADETSKAWRLEALLTEWSCSKKELLLRILRILLTLPPISIQATR